MKNYISNFSASQYWKSSLSWVMVMISISIIQTCYGQTVSTPINLTADTSRVIEIIGANSLRQITLGETVLTTLAGNARVRQGNTILEGDSIILDKQLGIAEVFGHVHINDADTVNTYAQYLKYMGNDQVAYLKDQVKLTDGRAVLTTNDLVYDLKTGLATYQNGGKVINENTVLTSKNATYYSNTKEVVFKEQVHLKDPKYDMVADSLRYNTAIKTAYFISPTHIKSSNGIIDTREGTYNIETGEASFLNRTILKDDTHFLVANQLNFDEKSNMIKMEGSAKVVDSANKVVVLGNKITIDKKNNTFLATDKPVMIIYKAKDSAFITADILFSGKKLKADTVTPKKQTSDSSLSNAINTTAEKSSADSINYFIGYHNVKIYHDSVQAVCDSMHYTSLDSTFRLFQHPICWNGNTQLTGDTMILYTENQQAKRLYVFNNSIVVNRTNEGFYNQLTGKTINAYFSDGNIDYIRTKGSPAESIFYPQNEDSAYIGMNRSKGDVIDIYFVDKNINKIKFVNDVSGKLYPMNKVPDDQKKLINFSWQSDKRPKSKFEILGNSESH